MCKLWPWRWQYDSVKVMIRLCDTLSRSNLAVSSTGPDMVLCMFALWPWPTSEIWPWVKVMTHPWVMDNDCVKYYPYPTWQWGVMDTEYGYECTVTLTLEIWPLVKVMTHQRAISVWNNIQIHVGSEELWPRHKFSVCVHCDLNLGDITLGQCHDTTLSHGY